MKKLAGRITSSQAWGGALLCIVLFLITGCKDFLDGGDIADQIQASILYANSPSHLIKISYTEGSGNVVKPAAGESLQKPTDTFEIKFEADQAYQFIYWKASSQKLAPSQNIDDYITIENLEKSETLVTFKKALDDIILTPVVLERPKALSWIPVSTGSLATRDSKIQVIFNRNMDPSSIYYTKKEIETLQNELGLQEQDFLPENSIIGISNIYGYKKPGSNGEEYIYKNITITDNEHETNINHCFKAPYFKSPTTLIIPVNKSNLPPAFSQISVSLDRTFSCSTKLDGIEQTLYTGQKKDWIYQVNDADDKNEPAISSCTIKYYDAGQKYLNIGEGEDIEGISLNSSDSNTVPEPSALQYLDTGARYIHLKLTAGDDEGLEPFFEVEFTRIQDEHYKDISNPSAQRTIFNPNYTKLQNLNSIFEGDIDISSLSDGVYSIKINAVDTNSNTTSYPKDSDNKYFYLAIDSDVHIDSNTLSIIDDNTCDYGLKLTWPNTKDLNELTIKYKKQTVNNWITKTVNNPNAINSATLTDTELEPATDYDFDITIKDNIGNLKNISLQNYTRPEAIVLKDFKITRITLGRETINNMIFTFEKVSKETQAVYCFATRFPPSSGTTTTVQPLTLNSNEDTKLSIPLQALSTLSNFSGTGIFFIASTRYRNKQGSMLVLIWESNAFIPYPITSP